ncbi:MAG: hypothetical protein VB141_11680 [Burkholderia gladioli]
MTFAKRRIDATITLGEGQFGEDKGKDVTLTGLRMRASVVTYTGEAQGALQLRVFGLPLDMINRLTRVSVIQNQLRPNSILLAAGTDESMSTVYMGQIYTAFGELQSQPEAALNMVAQAGAIDAVKPVGALSYVGAADAVDIMADLAKSMGYSFESNGVSVKLSNPYFPGTALDQVKSCARAANIYYTIERGVLAIWPKTQYRTADPIEISAATGMVGYPAFSADGLILRTEFNPNVQLGGRVSVKSELTVANGIWVILSIAHELESETPDGKWLTEIKCGRFEA